MVGLAPLGPPYFSTAPYSSAQRAATPLGNSIPVEATKINGAAFTCCDPKVLASSSCNRAGEKPGVWQVSNTNRGLGSVSWAHKASKRGRSSASRHASPCGPWP